MLEESTELMDAHSRGRGPKGRANRGEFRVLTRDNRRYRKSGVKCGAGLQGRAVDNTGGTEMYIAE